MKRFEYTQGSSNKFWEVEVSGDMLRVHYGRIGTKGQDNIKIFSTKDDALQARDVLVKEKLAKGYKEV